MNYQKRKNKFITIEREDVGIPGFRQNSENTKRCKDTVSLEDIISFPWQKE